MPEFEFTVQPPPTVVEIYGATQQEALQTLAVEYPGYAALAVQGPNDAAPVPLAGVCERCGAVISDADDAITRDAGDREITLCRPCARKTA